MREDLVFSYFREKMFELTGVQISPIKTDLLKVRLKSRLVDLGLNSYQDYWGYLLSLPAGHHEWQNFINRLTTNKTEWFREWQHYQYLQEVYLPIFLSSGKKQLRVWSAACSTGEEVYSLGLLLERELLGTSCHYEILASDVDTQVLSQAQNGVYPCTHLNDIPDELQAGIVRGREELSEWFRVRSSIKSKISFRHINLMSEDWGLKEDFDLIFCRNVFIYFPREVIQQIVSKMYHVSSAEGQLVIGRAESLQGITHSWKTIQPSIFKK